MALENTEVLSNLAKQKEDIEAKVGQFAQQRELLDNEIKRLQAMYSKIVGALEVLTQIEDSKVEGLTKSLKKSLMKHLKRPLRKSYRFAEEAPEEVAAE